MGLSSDIGTRQISRSNLAFEIGNKKRLSSLNIPASAETYYTAGEDLLENEAIYIATDGKIYKASYLDEPAVGFAKYDALADEQLQLVLEGKLDISGLTPGSTLYLFDGTPNFSTTFSATATNDIIQELGIVLSSTQVQINIEKPIWLE